MSNNSFRTNPYIFTGKPNLPATKNFVNKVAASADKGDIREAGVSGFKNVLNDVKNSKNQVKVEIEDLDKQTFSPYQMPGKTQNALRVNA